MYNPRDSNNNYEEEIQDVSNAEVKKKAQMDQVEDALRLANDGYEQIIDTDNTEARDGDSLMKICGDEEWVKRFETFCGPLRRS